MYRLQTRSLLFSTFWVLNKSSVPQNSRKLGYMSACQQNYDCLEDCSLRKGSAIVDTRSEGPHY
jgi:hypothetical protein